MDLKDIKAAIEYLKTHTKPDCSETFFTDINGDIHIEDIHLSFYELRNMLTEFGERYHESLVKDRENSALEWLVEYFLNRKGI